MLLQKKGRMEARCASDTPSSEYAQEPLEAGHEPTTEPTTEDTPFCVTEEEGIRRWKAEQANKALWDFGGRMRQVQQDWRRLQEEIRAAPPKRRRPAPQPPYSGPLLLLNQWYWEQSLGASISTITGDNMFGINMFLPHRTQQQQQPQEAHNGPCSSSSNTPAPDAAAAAAPDSSNSKKRRVTTSQADDATADATSEHSCPGSLTRAASSDGGSSSSSVVDVDAALLPPPPAAAAAAAAATSAPAAPVAAAAAAAPAEVYDFAEIEAVCQQQKLTHLPASRRFVRALRIIRAAKQQQQQQQQQQQEEAAAAALELSQQQQGMAVVQPAAGVSLVAVV